MLQSSLPTVIKDTCFTDRQPEHLPGKWSRGWESRPRKQVYEACLNLILPAVKLVESAGNAPASPCLQGKCIACLPRPHEKMASRPGAAPGKLNFGDSVAQAGARLIQMEIGWFVPYSCLQNADR